MIVEVTQTDIDQSAPGCLKCPVAQSFRRILKPTMTGAISKVGITIIGEGHEFVGLLPSVAQAFIMRYDDHNSVSPFTFEIELPQWAIQEEQS